MDSKVVFRTLVCAFFVLQRCPWAVVKSRQKAAELKLIGGTSLPYLAYFAQGNVTWEIPNLRVSV